MLQPLTTYQLIEETLKDPCASQWLRDALKTLSKRDPVDATADAQYLYELMAQRCTEILSNGGQP